MDVLEGWLAAKAAVVVEDGGVTRRAVPLDLVIEGAVVPGAELADLGVYADPSRAVELGEQLLARLSARGVRAVYGLEGPEWSASTLRELGFSPAIELTLRSFYLSLGVLGEVFEQKGPHPLRKAASFARRMRQKLIEVSFDEGWIESVVRVWEARAESVGFAVHRSRDYLAWRYRESPRRNYRLLVLRRNAGAGIDAYAVVEPIEPEPGLAAVRIVDHCSRSLDRVGDRRFMVELGLWCLSENVAMVEALGVQGSPLDDMFRWTGGFNRTWSGPLWWKALAPGIAAPRPASAAVRAGDLLAY